MTDTTSAGRGGPEARLETPVAETAGLETPLRGSSTRTPTPLRGSSTRTSLDALDALEAEAIHIIREVVAEFERPVLLFSGGKDSVVVLHLATKAFWPAKVPFPVLHVDTGHNFPEVLRFRDETVERLGIRLELVEVREVHGWGDGAHAATDAR